MIKVKNKNGIIGITSIFHFNENKNHQVILKPVLKVDVEKNVNNIISVMCTLSKIYILSSNGYVAMYSKNIIDFIPFNYSKIFIYSISTGFNHIIALDNNYEVWGWGDNVYRQVSPDINKNSIESPVKIEMNCQIAQVYAVKNSSLIIGIDNIVITWGSLLEQFPTPPNDSLKNQKYVKKLIKRKDIQEKINVVQAKGDILKTLTTTSYFYKTTLNSILNENNTLKNQQMKIKESMLSISEKLKEEEKKRYNSFVDISGNPKIKIVNITISEINNKIGKNYKTKELLLQSIVSLEKEIEDLRILVDKNEKEYEEISKEEIELNKKKDNAEATKNFKEKEECLNNLNAIIINKDAINKTKKNDLMKLDSKIKILNEIEKKYENKKKRFLQLNKNLFILQDIINLIQFQTLKEQKRLQSEDINKNQNESKKELRIFSELLALNEKINNASYLVINKNYPFQTVNEIIIQSNYLLGSIQSQFDTFQFNVFGDFKEKMDFICDLLHQKLKNIILQNKLILTLETFLSSFSIDVIYSYFPDRVKQKDINLHCGNSDISFYDFSQNPEYIYKEIITEFLKETFNIIEDEIMNKEVIIEQSVIQNYIEEKKKAESIILKRKTFTQNNKEKIYNWGFVSKVFDGINKKKDGNKTVYDNIISFSKDISSEHKQEETSKWSWI